MSEEQKLIAFSAQFHSRYLHALREIIDSADEWFGEREVQFLRVEPARAGGVLLIATNGLAMAVLHDPEGHATRSLGVRLPPHFRAAAQRRSVPLFDQGEVIDSDLPDYLQPGKVLLHSAGALLMLEGLHDDFGPRDQPCLAHEIVETTNHWRHEDLRFSFDLKYDWRAVFRKARAPQAALHLLPELYAMFAPIIELAGEGDHCWSLEAGEGENPSLVRLSSVPGFVGVIMPLRGQALAPLPDFLTRELTDA